MSALWGLLKGGLSWAWGYVVLGLTTFVAILATLRAVKKSGQNEVIVETQKKEIEDVKAANEVEREIAVAKPDARRERLYKRWSRD